MLTERVLKWGSDTLTWVSALKTNQDNRGRILVTSEQLSRLAKELNYYEEIIGLARSEILKFDDSVKRTVRERENFVATILNLAPFGNALKDTLASVEWDCNTDRGLELMSGEDSSLTILRWINQTEIPDISLVKFVLVHYTPSERTRSDFETIEQSFEIFSLTDLYNSSDDADRRRAQATVNLTWAKEYFLGPLGALLQCLVPRLTRNSPLKKLPWVLIQETARFLVAGSGN